MVAIMMRCVGVLPCARRRCHGSAIPTKRDCASRTGVQRSFPLAPRLPLFSLSFSLMPVALLPLLLGATLVAAQAPRSITFKNSCPKDVWVVGTSGATGSCADGCQEGSVCNESNGLCFFQVPAPSNGYRVKAGGDSTFNFPAWNNAGEAAWSGNFNACMQGTLCGANGKVADEATCDAQGCASFHVGTMAEITMLKRRIDYYDVSNIG